MRWTVWGSVLVGATAGVAAAAALNQQSGPAAVYWVSASTESGLGAGLMGAAGGPRRPGIGSMMALMNGRALDPSAVHHSLVLQLGSETKAPLAPAAEHDPPPGLGVGPSLALTTPEPPKTASPAPTTEPASEPQGPMERPKGKILMYWGCGEHASPGQPAVVDLSNLGAGTPFPRLQGAVEVHPEAPPSPYRWATYGRWPNEKNAVDLPATASLAGAHAVHSNYAPDIAFALGAQMDFMPPLGLRSMGPEPSGATRLVWTPPPQATGYHLSLMGGSKGRDGGGEVVFWSSSQVRTGVMGGGLNTFLPPGEVARLVAQRAVLPPSTGECLVPAEVMAAAPTGLVSMIAYGPEANFVDPPRPAAGPWRLRWTAKVRLKSTNTLLLGAGGPGAPRPRPPGVRDLLGGVLPIPH